MATIVATGIIFGVSAQSAQAYPTIPESGHSAWHPINNDWTAYVSGMKRCWQFATARVNTTLDVRNKPNGYLIGSVYNNDEVFVYDTYTDGYGVGWALVEYRITGTANDSKIGWVHSRYIYF